MIPDPDLEKSDPEDGLNRKIMNWISKVGGATRYTYPNSLWKETWQFPAPDILHYYESGIVVSVPDPTLPIVKYPDSIL
jgi:hypothetical protein